MNPNKTPDLDYGRLVKRSRQLLRAAVDAGGLLGGLRVALLSDAATQQFVPVLRALLADNGIAAQFYEGLFDAIELEAIDPASALHAFKPDFILVINSAQGLRARYYEHGIDAELPRIQRIWDGLAQHSRGRIIQCNLALPYDRPFGQFDLKLGTSLYTATRTLNSQLAEFAARRADVLLCDVEAIASYSGRRSWFDERLWDLSKTFCNLEHLPQVAQAMVDLILASLGRLVKCVICDLDNTLWGGVVGDAGPLGIEIGPHGNGEPYYRLQQYLLSLHRRGILLAACSKNEQANAIAAFQQNPDMLLKAEHFTVFVANWDNKADNIRIIQQTLDIGFDSMVFLDDNPFERNLVRTFLPEVIVPELPEDPADYVRALAELNLFETTAFSAEDTERAALYQREAQRRRARDSFTDVSEYLRSLEMQITVERFPEHKISRIAQLFARSNQFNLTTHRYSEADCLQMMRDTVGCIPLCASLRDRFGDHGLICIVVARPDGAALQICDWLMSCRVLARGVEEYLMNHVVALARDRGLATVTGEYIPTSKNQMVEKFWARFGFETADGRNWILETARYTPRTTWISERAESLSNSDGNVYASSRS
ncbi:MAG: HAD family hydrolase [Sinobacteraceae bacterium]|nr:HAD family hydrolase [Nevskiaceae bacterium]